MALSEHVDGLMKAHELDREEASETAHRCRDRRAIAVVGSCSCCQKSARTSAVGSLTDFLPKERSGGQGLARRVDSDEISSIVQIILESDLTPRI